MLAREQLQRILAGLFAVPRFGGRGVGRHRVQARGCQRLAVQLSLAAGGGKAVGKRKIHAVAAGNIQRDGVFALQRLRA